MLNRWVACRFECGFFLGLVSGGSERWRAFFWDLLSVVDGDGEYFFVVVGSSSDLGFVFFFFGFVGMDI